MIFEPQFHTKNFLGPKILRPEILLVPKKNSNQNFFGHKIFSDSKLFSDQIFLDTKFFFEFFFRHKFLFEYFFGPKIYKAFTSWTLT